MPSTDQESIIFFPELDELTFRNRKLATLCFTVCFALLPYGSSVVWKLTDGFDVSALITAIPDIAFASVVIAIGVYTNTFLAFVKAIGHQRLRSWTVLCGFLPGIFAAIAFVTYLRVAHVPLGDGPGYQSFLISAFSLGTTLVASFILQIRFLTDECRWARNHNRSLAA